MIFDTHPEWIVPNKSEGHVPAIEHGMGGHSGLGCRLKVVLGFLEEICGVGAIIFTVRLHVG
jgi:hypothetical protein